MLSTKDIDSINYVTQYTSSSTAILVQTSKIYCMLSSTKRNWVIDSGASNHMTGKPCIPLLQSSLLRVTLADDYFHCQAYTVQPTSPFIFSTVLYVPSSPVSLMSVTKITSSLKYFSNILSKFLHFFRDLEIKKTIGGGHEHAGLCYLDETPTFNICQSSTSTVQIHCSSVILRWRMKETYP